MSDVVICVSNGFDSWKAQRGDRQKSFLESEGFSTCVTCSCQLEDLREILRAQQPKVFINELWHVQTLSLEQLATEFPRVQFVNVEHQAPNFTPDIDMAGHYSPKERLRRLAREFPNVWSATVCDKVLFPEGFLELPNLVQYDKVSERKADSVGISIICRYARLKNISGQIQAVCEFAKDRKDVCLLIVSHHLHLLKRDERLLLEHRVPYRILPWQSYQIYKDLVDQFVDVGLQCSMSESFNLVAAEHMMMGKPVIGGDAIEFIHEELRVRTHRIDEIAERLKFTVDNLDRLKVECRDIALKVKDRNHKVFFETLKGLMR